MIRFVRFFSIWIIGIVFIQCDKEPAPRASSFETPIVTGFDFKDENNNSLGTFGIPNNNLHGELCDNLNSTKKGVSDNGYKYLHFNVYPNPCNNELSFNINGGSAKYSVWIVRANYYGGDLPSQLNDAVSSSGFNENSNILGANSIIAGGAPILYFEEINSSNFTINMNELELGCYRIYIDICGNLLWDNFLKTNE